MEKFDLIVIGSGSGLDVANAAASDKGLKVAIIEKYKLGGTCLNTGCIPSKLLIHSADIIETIKQADTFGITIKDYSIDFQNIVNRVNKIVDSDANNIKKGLQENKNPRLFLDECKFIGEKKIAISNNEIITADKILIASGTRPFIPKIKGLENVEYITSNEALRLKQQPKTLTIIGGGYIACELGHFFGSLGTQINIIQRNDLLIPNEDIDISTKFTNLFSKKYDVYLGYNVEEVYYDSKVEENNNNNDQQKIINVIAKNKSGDTIKFQSDQLLIATGRIPNSDLLNVKKSGIKINENGFILIDKYLETNMEGIFALGDAVGKYQFKHNANNEAQYAYNNIVYPDKKIPVNYTAMPHAIFTNPQIAGVGYTEQQLKKEEMIEYEKSIYPYINTAMGQAIEDKDGFVKFLVDKRNRRILGCHIMGTDASILIHEVLVAMRIQYGSTKVSEGGNINNITNTIHIHPALSEVVDRAASAL
jgi:mycothione reductase